MRQISEIQNDQADLEDELQRVEKEFGKESHEYVDVYQRLAAVDDELEFTLIHS